MIVDILGYGRMSAIAELFPSCSSAVPSVIISNVVDHAVKGIVGDTL